MSRLARLLYYNVDENYLVASNTVADETTELNITPSVFTNNKYIVKLELLSNVSGTYTGYPVNDITEWNAYFGNIREDLVSVSNTVFNNVSDWTSTSTIDGRVCFRLDLDTNVDTDIGTTTSKNYYCQVIGQDTDADIRTIAQWKFNTYNTVAEPDDYLSSSSSSS